MSRPPEVQPLYIRITHPAGFRSGLWAKVVDMGYMTDRNRPVYVVEFQDGRRDQWPVHDTVAGYEFAGGPS